MTLKLWADERTDGTQACCSPEAVRGARALAHSLGIPHLTLDLEAAFRREVVGAFVGGYRAGETPNPCVICNGDLRIDAMVALADRVGASHLATGHYARIADDGDGPLLAAAADEAKDQTYMLSGLPPGDPQAPPVPAGRPDQARGPRERGARPASRVASKRESQDLCFLAGEGKRSFLERHGGLADRPGEIVDRRRQRCWASTRAPPLHRRPAPRPRRGERRAALRARHRRRDQPGDRRPPRGAGDHDRAPSRRAAAP